MDPGCVTYSWKEDCSLLCRQVKTVFSQEDAHRWRFFCRKMFMDSDFTAGNAAKLIAI